jgi:hypothetical protein
LQVSQPQCPPVKLTGHESAVLALSWNPVEPSKVGYGCTHSFLIREEQSQTFKEQIQTFKERFAASFLSDILDMLYLYPPHPPSPPSLPFSSHTPLPKPLPPSLCPPSLPPSLTLPFPPPSLPVPPV